MLFPHLFLSPNTYFKLFALEIQSVKYSVKLKSYPYDVPNDENYSSKLQDLPISYASTSFNFVDYRTI